MHDCTTAGYIYYLMLTHVTVFFRYNFVPKTSWRPYQLQQSVAYVVTTLRIPACFLWTYILFWLFGKVGKY